MDSNLRCNILLGTEDWFYDNPKYFKLKNKADIEVVTEQELKKISSLVAPQGVLAVFNVPDHETPVSLDREELYIAVDNLQDPGNLGTIIRTADWYGIKYIFCSPDTVDCYNPKVVNATMASIARVKVHYQKLDTLLRSYEGDIYACVLDGEPAYTYQGKNNGMLVIGNESKGVSDNILSLAKHKISIPGTGRADSLNASVAMAILTDIFKRPL